MFALRHKRLLGAALREEVERRERVKRRPGVELSARLVAGSGLGPEGAQRVEVFEEGDSEVDGEVREPVGLGGNVLSWLEVVGREGRLVAKVRVEHHVAAQVGELDEELFPRRLPPVGGRAWDGDRGCAPGEARVLVLVEGCPRLREEE